MGRAKEIEVRVIPSRAGNEFIRKQHYSGKVVSNSSLHFGAFLDGMLHGVLSFGSPLDKRKVLGLVEGTEWNEMIELNRMAFDDYLPRNSESRVISICMKLLRKNAPQVKWVLSFADGTQCGDGTIYRASGFLLTLIKKNSDLFLLPNGEQIHSMTIKSSRKLMEMYGNWRNYLETVHPGWSKIPGFQLRYIYLIDKNCKLTCDILPFSAIDEAGARMYLGKNTR